MLRSHSYDCDVMKRLSNTAEHEMSSFTMYFMEAKWPNHDLEDDIILVQLYKRRIIIIIIIIRLL